jgi:hypothetical protein
MAAFRPHEFLVYIIIEEPSPAERPTSNLVERHPMASEPWKSRLADVIG